jgi:hypothetical protein
MLPRLLPKTTDELWYSEYTPEEQDKELDEALKAYETRVFFELLTVRFNDYNK